MSQDDLFSAGQAGRDEGMKKAVDHANAETPKWSAAAGQMLLKYMDAFPGPFTAPEVRDWATSQGLQVPPTNMAWGAVFMSAAKRGLIKRGGYTEYGNKTMHTRMVIVWERAAP